jgi:signal transduction histidine kinase
MDEIKTHTDQVSDFVEAAAHDLHAPLRKLSVLIDRVFTKHNDEFSDDARQYISRIDTCIDEMRSLIDGLAELAKADARIIDVTDCDLNEIVRQTENLLNDEIREKRAQIEVNTLPVVKGNYTQYRQLFKNLIENSIKFRRNQVSPEICISAETIGKNEKIFLKLPVDKKYFKIEISDHGIGFNQVNADKIFEPFVRLHSKSEYEGNGLGLSICKKIIDNHHGIIYAEGDENEGARFTLILPETP